MDDATLDLLARSAELRERSAELCARMAGLRRRVGALQMRCEELRTAWNADWATCRDMTRSVAAQSASDAISGLKIGVFAARHFVAPAAMEQPDALAVADAIIQIACETTDAKTAERLMARAVALFEEAGLPPDYDPETEPGYLLH